MPTLNQYLASIRHDRKMSLRQVEEASNREISNAYLSQLETGKIQQPSPPILSKLSVIYDIDYMYLMKLAGYMPEERPKRGAPRTNSTKISAFAEHNLTEDEVGQLLDYLGFIRSKGQNRP